MSVAERRAGAARAPGLLNHERDDPQIPDDPGAEPGAVVRTAGVIDRPDHVIGAGAAIDRETAMAQLFVG